MARAQEDGYRFTTVDVDMGCGRTSSGIDHHHHPCRTTYLANAVTRRLGRVGRTNVAFKLRFTNRFPNFVAHPPFLRHEVWNSAT